MSFCILYFVAGYKWKGWGHYGRACPASLNLQQSVVFVYYACLGVVLRGMQKGMQALIPGHVHLFENTVAACSEAGGICLQIMYKIVLGALYIASNS